MIKYKLLAIDLDGTLLSKDKKISKGNLVALKNYMEESGVPIITTGRSIVSVEKFVNKITKFTNIPMQYVVCFNGGFIKNLKTNQTIKNKIPSRVVNRIKEYVIKNKLVMWAYTEKSTMKKGVYVTKAFANFFVRLAKGVRLFKLTNKVKDTSSYKLNILSFSKKKIEQAYKYLKTKFGKAINISYTNPRLLELNLFGINKGFGVDYVAKQLNISHNQIASIGDSNNDLASFDSAKFKIAVKTKSKELIDAASLYLPYHKNAVADAINKHIIKKDMIQLVASDLDGTLLCNGSKKIDISAKNNIEEIVNVLDKKFVVCTGRNLDDCMTVAKYFKFKNIKNIYLIGTNGSLIFDVYNAQYIHAALMDKSVVEKLINNINNFVNNKKHDGEIACEVFTKYQAEKIVKQIPQIHYYMNREFIERMYLAKHPGMLTNFWAKRINKSLTEIQDCDEICKCILHFESQQDRARMFALLRDLKLDIELSSSGSNNIEIMPLNTSKGAGLQRLCDYLSIDIKQTLPIGDENNDISMLSLSPNSVTLKTSHKQVQEAASYVLDEKTSVVVAKAIDMLILKGNGK